MNDFIKLIDSVSFSHSSFQLVEFPMKTDISETEFAIIVLVPMHEIPSSKAFYQMSHSPTF